MSKLSKRVIGEKETRASLEEMNKSLRHFSDSLGKLSDRMSAWETSLERVAERVRLVEKIIDQKPTGDEEMVGTLAHGDYFGYEGTVFRVIDANSHLDEGAKVWAIDETMRLGSYERGELIKPLAHTCHGCDRNPFECKCEN